MAQLGLDSDVILNHPQVNGGQPYGFLFAPNAALRIAREVSSDDRLAPGGVRVTVSFDLLLADQQCNPDGSRHTPGRNAVYAMLLNFLAQREGIAVQSMLGTLVNLGALGVAGIERHYTGHSQVHVSLNNAGYYFPPVPSETLNQSLWDGMLTWDTAYWR